MHWLRLKLRMRMQCDVIQLFRLGNWICLTSQYKKPWFLHFIFEWLFTQKLKFQEGRMLKAPPLKSLDLHFSVFQDRSERGAFNKMFEKVFMMTTSPPSCHTLSQKCKPPPPSPWVVWMSSSILYLDGLKLRYQPVKYIVLSSQKMDLELSGFELGTFPSQTQRSTTEPTGHLTMSSIPAFKCVLFKNKNLKDFKVLKNSCLSFVKCLVGNQSDRRKTNFELGQISSRSVNR